MTSTFIEVKLGLDKLLEENEFKLSLVVARSISLNLNILIPLHTTKFCGTQRVRFLEQAKICVLESD